MNLNWSDVTPKADYLNRRAFMAGGLGFATLPNFVAAAPMESPNSYEEITNYNNFYEFGFGKEDPARYSASFNPNPWSVEISGLVDRPGNYDLDDLAPSNAVEERIYKLRCVEAWSMVIPWLGVPLASVLKKVGVQSSAKFVVFETVMRPSEMPGQAQKLLDFPYVEGLRLDEAMNPLTLLATGLYGKPLPNQNGAPIRLVVPWKYGFKSAKSIAKITLTDKQPLSTWQKLQPREYGFYANVNPEVDHPRWSQATERRIGAGLLAGREKTLMFNGYGQQVAHLYSGMDLTKNF